MLEHGCFITGTDTGVGKTYVASLLIRALRTRGEDCVGLKPICCGDRTDAVLLHRASDCALSLTEVNPIWFRLPVAPLVAAREEHRNIDIVQLCDQLRQVRNQHRMVIVEGAGGWLVPITEYYLVADLAADIGLPIVVVAPNKLGVINHTLLTLQAIAAREQLCVGVILNENVAPAEIPDPATTTNRAVLESLMKVPLLCAIAYRQSTLPSFW